ncbi:DUF4214 domain-containing protein [Massilia aurea]|uniref:DUF4214 domain-containing protein n=1 Tax=Massilia aurea TaxID=373040 RepID=UPI0034628E55
MASIQLYRAFDFRTAQDWDWTITEAVTSRITIEGGGFKQTFSGAFTYVGIDRVTGTVTGSSFFENNAEVYRVSDALLDAGRIAQFARNELDTQQTYAYVLGGADTITGSAGNDFINGYGGIDTAMYAGSAASYTLRGSDSSFAVTGAAGSDTLVNVERLKFADKSIAIDVGANDNGGTIYRLYEAALDRAPDLIGLGFWIDRLDDGANIVDIAADFIRSAEYTTMYGSVTSNTELVTKYYTNILDRAPDAGGLAYWSGLLDTGKATTAQVLEAISDSTENIAAVAPLIANGFEYVSYG